MSYEYRRVSSERGKVPASVFGRRLRAVRLQARVPQDKLGVKIGLDEGTASARISRYETGTHAPPFELAIKIARLLGVPTAYFYCEDEALAEIILAWGKASSEGRRAIQEALAAMALASSPSCTVIPSTPTDKTSPA